METVVPFDAVEPNTRLASVLDATERRAFAEAMLSDVLDTLRAVGHQPSVVTTAAVDWIERQTVDDRPLTTAVNAILADREPDHDQPVAVVMADLPLVTPATLDRLTGAERATRPADVTIAPGLGGGTNALVVRQPAFRVDYHGASCRDHERIARETGGSVRTVDSRRLATDVDEPADLAEVLLHTTNTAAREWLVDAGFRLDTTDGRVTVER